MERSRTRNSAPCDRRVIEPGHARTGLDEARGDQALLDAPGRLEVDIDSFRVERVAVLHDNAAKLLEVEPGRHLLWERRDQLLAGHPAQRLECIRQSLGQRNHFRPALFDLPGAYCDAHEVAGTAEIV